MKFHLPDSQPLLGPLRIGFITGCAGFCGSLRNVNVKANFTLLSSIAFRKQEGSERKMINYNWLSKKVISLACIFLYAYDGDI